jgi:DNA-binding PadR family transcriptional regulator
MSKPALPTLTHLQFLVLGVLSGGDRPGRGIRDVLAHYGIRRTAPAFYQLMARLEKDKLVQGRYEPVTVGDQTVTERWYTVTPAGLRRWQAAQAFYEQVSRAAARLRWSDT